MSAFLKDLRPYLLLINIRTEQYLTSRFKKKNNMSKLKSSISLYGRVQPVNYCWVAVHESPLSYLFCLGYDVFAMLRTISQRRTLTFIGLGSVHLGLSQAQLKSLGFKVFEEPSGYEECVEVTLNGDDKVLVMLENDQVKRASSYDPTIKKN